MNIDTVLRELRMLERLKNHATQIVVDKEQTPGGVFIQLLNKTSKRQVDEVALACWFYLFYQTHGNGD